MHRLPSVVMQLTFTASLMSACTLIVHQKVAKYLLTLFYRIVCDLCLHPTRTPPHYGFYLPIYLQTPFLSFVYTMFIFAALSLHFFFLTSIMSTTREKSFDVFLFCLLVNFSIPCLDGLFCSASLLPSVVLDILFLLYSSQYPDPGLFLTSTLSVYSIIQV